MDTILSQFHPPSILGSRFLTRSVVMLSYVLLNLQSSRFPRSHFTRILHAYFVSTVVGTNLLNPLLFFFFDLRIVSLVQTAQSNGQVQRMCTFCVLYTLPVSRQSKESVMLYAHSETCLVSIMMTETTEAIFICELLTFKTKGQA
jgi:hypothetical protein